LNLIRPLGAHSGQTPHTLSQAHSLYYITNMWNARLRKPIRLEDGRTIRTLGDARDVVLSLPKRDQHRQKWEQFARLLVTAAETGHPALTSIVTNRLEQALRSPPFTTVRLAGDIERQPAANLCQPAPLQKREIK
jgi:hypothetical protein